MYFPPLPCAFRSLMVSSFHQLNHMEVSQIKIENVLADEKVLDEQGRIDCGKLNTFLFDQMRNDYYAVGEVCGKAWHSGASLLKK